MIGKLQMIRFRVGVGSGANGLEIRFRDPRFIGRKSSTARSCAAGREQNQGDRRERDEAENAKLFQGRGEELLTAY